MFEAQWNPTCSSTLIAQVPHGPQVKFDPGVSSTKLLPYEYNKHVTGQEKRGRTLVYYVHASSWVHIALV